MPRLCAQGDILIERVEHAQAGPSASPRASPHVFQSVENGSIIIAEGELTGHHHRLFGTVTLYRDDALARGVPAGLYVGHVEVESPMARLEHEEHAPIALERGTYRIRRQRQLEPTDIGIHEHFSAIGD